LGEPVTDATEGKEAGGELVFLGEKPFYQANKKGGRRSDSDGENLLTTSTRKRRNAGQRPHRASRKEYVCRETIRNIERDYVS